MLGNWSFGDYYKEEAIAWAWELLTREWQLPKEHLWATVYLDDDEAERLWIKVTGIPTDRILRFGQKENFWEMGETGPCGPCSEIHLDRGLDACDRRMVKGHRCLVNGDCARYIELWNLVFIQYNRNERGELQDLPAKHVDTGMGMERITAVLQGVLSNYDIDYMRDLIRTTEELAGRKYSAVAEQDVSFRVIADHARAVAFLIADGVAPSNEGRGYVLRRLLRRAARHGRLLGLTDPFLYQVAATVETIMGEAYPELGKESLRIRDIIHGEEQRFAETLEKGSGLLEQTVADLKREGKTLLPGEIAFRLYDTYGFPLDLTEDILSAEGIAVDRPGFEKEMGEQRTRAREARQTAQTDFGFKLDHTVRFIGYDRLDAESAILAIYAEGQGKEEAHDGEAVDLITAETPFYGESGGQVGDRGTFETARGDLVEVLDTQHPTPQLTVHKGRVKRGRIQVGDRVYLRVDAAHRQRTKLNHSATHILHSVLREELGTHVRQAGSLVAADRLRFDFSHTGAIDPEKVQEIERRVNERIRTNAEVRVAETSYEEAVQKGALAFFGDKYGDRVRVVKIGDFSTELCGGTHVGHSGEIGVFKLQAEGGIAAGVRRIEAVTGEGALELVRRYEHSLREISDLLRGSVEETAERVRKLLQQQRELEKEIERLRAQLGQNRIPDLLQKRQQINGANVIISRLDGIDPKQLREIADQIKEQMGSGVVVLASPSNGNVSVVSSVTKDLTKRFHAGNIVKELAAIVGGGGGGRPDFAQAGGKNPARVDEALRRAEEIIKEAK
jgi:alanyl-tRNA synthetase